MRAACIRNATLRPRCCDAGGSLKQNIEQQPLGLSTTTNPCAGSLPNCKDASTVVAAGTVGPPDSELALTGNVTVVGVVLRVPGVALVASPSPES